MQFGDTADYKSALRRAVAHPRVFSKASIIELLIMCTLKCLMVFSILVVLFSPTYVDAAERSPWRSLFNGRSLDGWDTYLAPPLGGREPIGLNRDPRGVFSVTNLAGVPVIRISGEVYGAITTQDEFENFHIRVEYRWGDKRWPPRAQVGRDSGILYWCVGPHGAGSGAWMRSVECNIMERGTGQWWSVADTLCDIAGRRVTPDMESWVPYKKEGPSEKIIVFDPTAPRLTATPSDGVTPAVDYEKPHGEWNLCEVVGWGGVGIHLLNGHVNLALTHPRYSEVGREIPLRQGKIQIQSEGAEVFYRKIEIRPLSAIPSELLAHVPSWQDDERGFKPLFGRHAQEGWAQCGPGHYVLTNGVATGVGGMGLWWYTNQMFANFVLRGEFVQEGDIADSGVFIRFPNPGNDPWVAVHKGHEMEIGDPNPQDPTWRTGSIYPFQASITANTKPYGQWNNYELIALGHNYSVRMNGQLVTTWTDPKQRTTFGYLGLQNYDDGKIVRHRNLRVKELP